MSQSTRTFGAMISGVTIGGVSFVAVCEQIEADWEFMTQLATALKDTSEYPIGIRDKWSINGTFFISTAGGAGEGGPGGTLWTKALQKAQVAVAITDNAIPGGGNTLSGFALITRCTQSIPDGPQTIRVTLTGQGGLSSSIT